MAAWVFGAVWYGALSKPYQRALGRDPEQSKGQKMPLAPMVVSFVSELVMAFLFARLLSGLGVIGWQDGADWQTNLTLLKETGGIAEIKPLGTYYSNDYLQ